MRYLVSLPAKITTLKNYRRIAWLFVLFAGLANKGYAQQPCTVPYIVDLSASPNVLYTDPGHVRMGNCDGDKNCISYKVLLNPGTDVLAISSGQFANSDSYYIDGDGPYPVDQPACVSGDAKGYVIITFCKPGSNVIAITFSTSAGISTSPDISLRQGCTGTISVTGMIQSSIKWSSIAPGNPGDYNSYLSTTSGASVVTVTPPAVPPASGYVDYQVTGIEQSPCNTISKAATIRTYFYPALTASISSSAPTVCSGNPVTLTATASGGNPGDPNNPSYTYSWNTGATTPSISVASPGTYTVTVNDLLPSCGAFQKSITIGATAVVAPTVPTVTVCTGQQPTLTATGPGGPYQWYNSAGSLVSSSDTYSPTGLGPGTYYFTVVTSYGGCPSPSTTATLNIVAPPPAPSAASQSICNGSSATLTASGVPGATYQWYNAAGNLVGNNASYNTGNLTNSSTGNYLFLYTVVQSNGICSSPPTSVTVTVLPTPAGPAAPSQTICNNTSATLNATGPAGATYQWYNNAGTLVGSNASYITGTLTTGTYNYTVVATVGGCPSTPTPVTVTVLPTPAGPTAPSQTICNNTSATLNASGPAGATYQWYNAAGNLVGSSASYNTGTLTTGTYNYTVVATVGGCPSAPTPVTVTVLPTPAGPTAPSQTICNNTSATVNASGPAGATYQWYNAAGNLVGSSASYNTGTLTTGTYNYTVVATLGGCPSAPTPVTVTVLPTPAGPTAPSQTICNNTSATVNASGPASATYQWYNAAGNLVGSSASYNTGTLTTGTYNYTVVATVGGCPSAPTPVTVTVLPTPPPPAVLPATICDGFTATLTATAPGAPYQWYDSAGTLVGTGTSYTTPVLTTGATNTVYTYTVTDSSNGCPSSSTTVTVTVTPTPPTPTVQTQ